MITLGKYTEDNAERLPAWVYSENRASLRVLEKAGFARDALLRNALYKHDKLHDEYVYSLLRP